MLQKSFLTVSTLLTFAALTAAPPEAKLPPGREADKQHHIRPADNPKHAPKKTHHIHSAHQPKPVPPPPADKKHHIHPAGKNQTVVIVTLPAKPAPPAPPAPPPPKKPQPSFWERLFR